MTTTARDVIRAGATYFAIVFGTGFVLGTIRVPFLVPRLGERVAELIEMPAMLIAIWLSAGWLVRRHAARIQGATWWLVGVVALLSLLAAEVMVGMLLMQRSIAELVTHRDPVSGTAYLIMLLIFTAMPWARRRSSDEPNDHQ